MSMTYAATRDDVLPDTLRLHVLCLLDTGQWRRFTFVCQAAGITQDRLKRHFFALRSGGYVETRRGIGQEGWARLTTHGAVQRDTYLSALVVLAGAAGDQVAIAQHEQPDWFAPVTAS